MYIQEKLKYYFSTLREVIIASENESDMQSLQNKYRKLMTEKEQQKQFPEESLRNRSEYQVPPPQLEIVNGILEYIDTTRIPSIPQTSPLTDEDLSTIHASLTRLQELYDNYYTKYIQTAS